MDWTRLETTAYQDHVIAHVLGATVLGWFVLDGAAHLLLDMKLLWTIYLDGQMNLLPQGVAIADFDSDEVSKIERKEIALDAQNLISDGREARNLKYFT